MISAIWKGYGKRLKFGKRNGPRLTIYGHKFLRNIKTVLSEEFIEEAGLRNESTYAAVVLSLKTDYGIFILKNTEGFKSSPRKRKAEKEDVSPPTPTTGELATAEE